MGEGFGRFGCVVIDSERGVLTCKARRVKAGWEVMGSFVMGALD